MYRYLANELAPSHSISHLTVMVNIRQLDSACLFGKGDLATFNEHKILSLRHVTRFLRFHFANDFLGPNDNNGP